MTLLLDCEAYNKRVCDSFKKKEKKKNSSMESSTESYRNTIEKTMNKALSPGASQHFCEVHRATFGPTVLMGSLGLTWPLPFCLSTCFLKEQELEDSGKC